MPLDRREEFSQFLSGLFDKVPRKGRKKGGHGDAHQCVDPPKPGRRQVDKELLNCETVEVYAVGIVRALNEGEPLEIGQPEVNCHVSNGQNPWIFTERNKTK